MRIIAGSHRGRKLQTIEGRSIRPTPERVKEALFSMIQWEVPGALVLDLFSGTGQLGIEALSRGARLCVFVDSSREGFALTKQNLTDVGLFSQARVVQTDAMAFLQSTKDRFDIALLDPPYAAENLVEVVEAAARVMAENGLIVVETDSKVELPDRAGSFVLDRKRRYSHTALHLYRAQEEAMP